MGLIEFLLSGIGIAALGTAVGITWATAILAIIVVGAGPLCVREVIAAVRKGKRQSKERQSKERQSELRALLRKRKAGVLDDEGLLSELRNRGFC